MPLLRNINKIDVESVVKQYEHLNRQSYYSDKNEILGVGINVLDTPYHDSRNTPQARETTTSNVPKLDNTEAPVVIVSESLSSGYGSEIQSEIFITSELLPVECAPGTKFEDIIVSKRVCRSIG